MKKLIPFLFLLACSSQPKYAGTDMEKSYQKALKLTESAQADRAVEEWDIFLKQYPATELSASAHYQKAYSHEQLGQYQSAVNMYRSAITIWGVRGGSDRAQALLRISACYEAMGDNAKSLGAIQELERTKNILTAPQREIEIPARKALLYAKEGNQAEAKKYYTIASKNMNQYLRKSSGKNTDWLAEILFRLSETDPSLALPDFSAAIESMKINQSYLAKVIETQTPFWSEKALNRLKLQYEGLSRYIQKYVAAKEIAEMREQQEQQKSMAATFVDLIDKLPQEFLLQSKAFEDKVEEFQQQTKKQMADLMMEPISGEGLTDEAKARQGVRRIKEVKPATQELPAKVKKDPNL